MLKQIELYQEQTVAKKDEEKKLQEIHDDYKQKFTNFDKNVKQTKKQINQYDKELSLLDRKIRDLEDEKRKIQLSHLRLIDKETSARTPSSAEPEEEESRGGRRGKKGKKGKGGGQQASEQEMQRLKELNLKEETEKMKEDWGAEQKALLELKEQLARECKQLEEQIKEKKQ